jgi:hypothetical protein
MLAPVTTLLVLLEVADIVMIVRNLVLGVAFSFVIWNVILSVTDADPQQKGLCIFMTLVVTTTYLVSIRKHSAQSIKDRDWKGWLTGREYKGFRKFVIVIVGF